MSERTPKPEFVDAEQFEFRIDGRRLREGESDLGFQLVPEHGTDWQRLEAERAAAEAARAQAEAAQGELF